MTVSMGAIGDEIREFVRRSYADEHMDPRELLAIADRADRDLVELPRDRDGVPIHVGDTVYLDNGRKAEVSRIILGQEKTSIDLWMCDKGSFFFSVAQRDITHATPDSWARIADELEAWCNRTDVEGDACDVPRGIGERIRKLAKEQDDE